jgi:GTPase SAR1 family protein
MKTVALEKTNFIKLLAYGESGTGKTTLLGSFQEDERSSPLLVLNCGGQPTSLRFVDPPPLVLEIESTADLNPPYNWFAEGQPWETIEANIGHTTISASSGHARLGREDPFCRAVYDYFDGQPGQFKTVAIDGISDLQQTCVREISKQPRRPGDRPKLVELGHWGTIRQQTNNIVTLMYHLDMHVIMTALTDHKYIEAFGRTEYSPLLNTKSAMEVPAQAQIVGRLMAVVSLNARDRRDATKVAPNAFNVLRTTCDADFAAKWQGVREPPAALFNPRAKDLLDIIEGG